MTSADARCRAGKFLAAEVRVSPAAGAAKLLTLRLPASELRPGLLTVCSLSLPFRHAMNFRQTGLCCSANEHEAMCLCTDWLEESQTATPQASLCITATAQPSCRVQQIGAADEPMTRADC